MKITLEGGEKLAFLNKTRIRTDRYPDRYVSATAEITDEYDSDNVADLVRTRNEARKAGRDLKSLLYGCYHRIDVT